VIVVVVKILAIVLLVSVVVKKDIVVIPQVFVILVKDVNQNMVNVDVVKIMENVP